MKALFSPLFFTLLFCLACGSQPDPAAASQPALPEPPRNQPSAPEPEILFAWVDDLNLREAPKTSSPVVATLQVNDALIFHGEKTDFTEKIALRGQTYDEPWLKVTTKKDQTGWVFGGAVRRQGEAKGTPQSKEGLIDIAHFGRYELSRWEKETETTESVGDADITRTTYSLGTQLLRITSYETGEYGYGRTYRLLGSDGEVLKARELDWSSDPTHTLTEKVYDFTQTPARAYLRSQVFTEHFSRLQPRPETVEGDFTTLSLSPAEAEELLERLGKL
ncbi:SH3 domain-containing protein [Neolewinella lacunae]|uniref:SH3 domain-containing protein n=1 Tax=Neolewinella lacunae TaxID=1517758 RepID=A0A923PQW6_9BACT|nr:SH3 domain-containing protein [Neolewinella lacunae]MBC6996121.1 SH3 domain-containing protein [Neolewinella lacunae]MDN3633974.1 SH3 domain-containing protein [Neolewinella lacunae]